MNYFKKKRIGVYGGTFNPIHLGHLITAEAVREEFNLHQVIFVVAATPPHKSKGVIEAHHRFAMTSLAILNNPYFIISDIEMKREGFSYTIDTIRGLKEIYGEETDFFFIAGTDTIHELPNWKYINELLALCHFVGATRPDGSEVIDSVIDYFGDLGKQKIHRLHTPELEISSTDIRKRLFEGKSVKYMLPRSVIKYIKDHHIYGVTKDKIEL